MRLWYLSIASLVGGIALCDSVEANGAVGQNADGFGVCACPVPGIGIPCPPCCAG